MIRFIASVVATVLILGRLNRQLHLFGSQTMTYIDAAVGGAMGFANAIKIEKRKLNVPPQG